MNPLLQLARLFRLGGRRRKSIHRAVRVTVDGTLWVEVPSLDTSGPGDHVYVAKTNDDGSTEIIFGDGRTGARLPSGNSTIARYRVSASSGNAVVYLDIRQRVITAVQDGDLGDSALGGPDTGECEEGDDGVPKDSTCP